MTVDWVFDGGRGCLDLVNTVRERHADGREQLVDAESLSLWLAEAGLTDGRMIVSEAELALAKVLRETVDRVTQAVTHGENPDRADIVSLNSTAEAAVPVVPQLRVDAEGQLTRYVPAPAKPVATAIGALAVDAIDLVATRPIVRVCAAPDCGLRFLDTSPKRNRQWCSMARCGNRAKARAHYARYRQQG